MKKILPLFLVLFFSSTSSLAQRPYHDGPLQVLKDPNVVFYLDSENIPDILSIDYVEDVLVESLNEFNNIDNATLSLSYGGIIDGACEHVYITESLPPGIQRDPDRDVVCFIEDFGPLGAAETDRTFDSSGKIHERSNVVIDPVEGIGTYAWFNIHDFALFKHLLLHELGHVVGLGHVTQNVIDKREFDGGSVVVVGPEKPPTIGALQPYDIAQLQVLYPTDIEKYPEYPMYCMQKVGSRPIDVHPDDVDPGDYYFNHLVDEGSAYDIKVNLNLQKVRFDVLSEQEITFQPNRDCGGLEWVNGEIFLPYIIFRHSIYELVLRLDENSDGLYLNIVAGCRIYPEPKNFCSIEP